MSSEKRTSARRKRYKRTTPAKASAAGGEWGEHFRERLRQLVKTHATSNAAFARDCGIQAPRLCEWLAGEQVPSAESLRAVANAFSVSLDWLLDGVNHQGEKSAAPVYRGQWRDMPAFERDLVAFIRREVGESGDFVPNDFNVNAAAILHQVAEDVREEMQAYGDWMNAVLHTCNAAIAALKLAETGAPSEERTSALRQQQNAAVFALARVTMPAARLVAPSEATSTTVRMADLPATVINVWDTVVRLAETREEHEKQLAALNAERVQQQRLFLPTAKTASSAVRTAIESLEIGSGVR